MCRCEVGVLVSGWWVYGEKTIPMRYPEEIGGDGHLRCRFGLRSRQRGSRRVVCGYLYWDRVVINTVVMVGLGWDGTWRPLTYVQSEIGDFTFFGTSGVGGLPIIRVDVDWQLCPHFLLVLVVWLSRGFCRWNPTKWLCLHSILNIYNFYSIHSCQFTMNVGFSPCLLKRHQIEILS